MNYKKKIEELLANAAAKTQQDTRQISQNIARAHELAELVKIWVDDIEGMTAHIGKPHASKVIVYAQMEINSRTATTFVFPLSGEAPKEYTAEEVYAQIASTLGI